MISELENLSYGEKLEYSYYLEALKDTIALLEDYTIPIKDDMGNVDEDNDILYTQFLIKLAEDIRWLSCWGRKYT